MKKAVINSDNIVTDIIVVEDDDFTVPDMTLVDATGARHTDTWTGTEFVNPERDAKEAAWAEGADDRAFAALRQQRDQLLNNTDWWVLRGSISESQTTYRQQLRDLPANTPDPANPTWPVAPE
jgi:hypothetical protein